MKIQNQVQDIGNKVPLSVEETSIKNYHLEGPGDYKSPSICEKDIYSSPTLKVDQETQTDSMQHQLEFLVVACLLASVSQKIKCPDPVKDECQEQNTSEIKKACLKKRKRKKKIRIKEPALTESSDCTAQCKATAKSLLPRTSLLPGLGAGIQQLMYVAVILLFLTKCIACKPTPPIGCNFQIQWFCDDDLTNQILGIQCDLDEFCALTPMRVLQRLQCPNDSMALLYNNSCIALTARTKIKTKWFLNSKKKNAIPSKHRECFNNMSDALERLGYESVDTTPATTTPSVSQNIATCKDHSWVTGVCVFFAGAGVMLGIVLLYFHIRKKYKRKDPESTHEVKRLKTVETNIEDPPDTQNFLNNKIHPTEDDTDGDKNS
ncbi:uncharacterized protein O3C94_014171 [Discoglossus pictus]